MPETLVLCGGVEATAGECRKVVELDASPNARSANRIDFSTERVCAPLLDDLPDVLADAVELAVYVFCADRLVPRGASKVPIKMGSEWQRDLRFRVPVRAVDIWKRHDVRSALTDVLSFLSGDRLAFEFVPATAPVSVEPFLGFGDPNAQIIQPDRVMLFSGGLDSLAGVARDVIGAGKSAVLVTHQSANAIMDHQDRLFGAIEKQTGPGRVFYAPVRVRRGAEKPCEFSQRMRSFLFATLGAAYARMFGLSTVNFYENGITSFNLPVAEHVLGTRASRTTHPRVLAGYGRLFSLLIGEQVTFENAFLWHTKADVVRTTVEHGCADLIRLTTSCASIHNYSVKRQQCGTCSQCVERRVAMIAAGVGHLEESYERDIFTGPIEDARALTMVEGHLVRANRLKGMTQAAFLANHGQVFRALGSMEGSPNAAARRIFDLHQRYGREFVDVVDKENGRCIKLEHAGTIAPRSLFAFVFHNRERFPIFRDASEQEPPASKQPAVRKPKLLTVVFAVDRKQKKIVVHGGGTLTGKSYEILARLVEHRRAGLRERNPAAELPYLSTRSFAEQMSTDEQNLRQQVDRARDNIEKLFEQTFGYTLDRDDVIQSTKWKGYRLNRHVIVAPLEEVLATHRMSRGSGPDVTTHSVEH